MKPWDRSYSLLCCSTNCLKMIIKVILRLAEEHFQKSCFFFYEVQLLWETAYFPISLFEEVPDVSEALNQPISLNLPGRMHLEHFNGKNRPPLSVQTTGVLCDQAQVHWQCRCHQYFAELLWALYDIWKTLGDYCTVYCIRHMESECCESISL